MFAAQASGNMTEQHYDMASQMWLQQQNWWGPGAQAAAGTAQQMWMNQQMIPGKVRILKKFFL